MSKIYIYGASGFGREVIDLVRDIRSYSELECSENIVLIDDNPNLLNVSGLSLIPSHDFNPEMGEVVVAIADPNIRRSIVDKLPEETVYATLIHPSAQIGRNTKISKGSIICAGVIVTCNIEIGIHSHLNLGTTVGHDCNIGDYFTTAPHVNISGSCSIKDNVYFGTKAATKQGVNIVSDVIVGLGANVLKSLIEPGTYVGTPAKMIVRG